MLVTKRYMQQPYLTVVIPAFQEAGRLESSLHAITSFLRQQPWTWELIIVDDGSTDGTGAIAKRFRQTKEPRIRVIAHARNQGKGAAVRDGMLAANGKYCVFTDADNATPIEELAKLLHAVERGADIAIGSRYVKGSDVRKSQNLFRRLMSRMGNLLFRLLLGLNLSDTRCGFKLFTQRARDVTFPRQTLMRFGFDTEVLLIAKHHNLRVRELPVVWYDRERGTVHPFRDSLRSLGEIAHMMRMTRKGYYHR